MKARMPKAERHVSKKEIRILCDMIMMTAMIVLIEQFQFGCKEVNGKKPRLQTFVDAMEKQFKYFGRVFDSEAYDGIKGRLESYGVYYGEMKGDDGLGD